MIDLGMRYQSPSSGKRICTDASLFVMDSLRRAVARLSLENMKDMLEHLWA